MEPFTHSGRWKRPPSARTERFVFGPHTTMRAILEDRRRTTHPRLYINDLENYLRRNVKSIPVSKFIVLQHIVSTHRNRRALRREYRHRIARMLQRKPRS